MFKVMRGASAVFKVMGGGAGTSAMFKVVAGVRGVSYVQGEGIIIIDNHS